VTHCVCVYEGLFHIRNAHKQYAREHTGTSGDKTEKPYIYKPSAPLFGGPSSSDGKPVIGVCW